MKHLRTVAIIALLLFAMNVFSWGILKQGDKFLPFSLVSSHDEIYTVTLVDGKLTVTIQHTHTGFKEKDIEDIENTINDLPKEKSR